MDGPSGVVFPADATGRRSTSALGREVVADALAAVDPVGARAARHETDWRHGYLIHFKRLVEAGLDSTQAAVQIATDGLASLHRRMQFIRRDGTPVALDQACRSAPDTGLQTVTVTGTGPAQQEFWLPYRGARLRGEALRRQLDTWVAAGVIEPSCAAAVGLVADHPQWLPLAGHRVLVLGAGAEMGPTQALLRWGAEVVAVDLPRPAIWSHLLDLAGRYAGTLHLPVAVQPGGSAGSDAPAGADLLHDLPAVAGWLAAQPAPWVLGNYVYADGATNVRVSTAVDVLGEHLRALQPELAMAVLATPTDVFAVPAEAVAHAERAYQQRTAMALVRGPLRALSAGRLLRRNYPPGADPGLADSLVPAQGPNYALAKRIQRWRATVARHAGATVSLTVAPPTRTRSVLKNRALAAAYAGAHLFNVEVFEPATSNTLMAAILVHDLCHPSAPSDAVWQDEARCAAHGGLWRTPYAPRSAFGLAAVLGFGGART